MALDFNSLPPDPPMRRKVWTRQECQLLLEHGFFESQRYELVGGDVIDKAGQSVRHAYTLSKLTVAWSSIFGDRLRPQLPVELSPVDEPEPDLVITRGNASFMERHPGPADIAWLIEVSDTTLRFDLTVKAGLYARAGVADYWVLDLVNRRVIVHREPQDGQYASVNVYADDEAVAPLASPSTLLRYAELTGL